MKLAGSVVLVLAAALAAWWLWPRDAWHWTLPAGQPPPAVPADNPMSRAKVAVGRRLFYDRRLSVTGELACAGCHRQELAFTDGLALAVGATGERHPRSSMSLVNVAYASRLNWANHLLDRLEIQALTPLFGEEPVEMGMAGREAEVVALLREDPVYARAMADAFPGDDDPYTLLNALRALASFLRSIVSFDSPYDRFLRGDTAALAPAAQRGMELFFSERLECFHCHGGFNFSDSSTHASAVVESVGYHNNGLYNIGGSGGYPPGNTGLYDLTGQRRDMGRFRAPSLRNVAVTAPYMHDGSLATLAEVVAHYARGGRLIETGPHAGDGRHNPYRSPFVQGFELDGQETADLLAFLAALTDRSVLEDPRFSDPSAPAGAP